MADLSKGSALSFAGFLSLLLLLCTLHPPDQCPFSRDPPVRCRTMHPGPRTQQTSTRWPRDSSVIPSASGALRAKSRELDSTVVPRTTAARYPTSTPAPRRSLKPRISRTYYIHYESAARTVRGTTVFKTRRLRRPLG